MRIASEISSSILGFFVRLLYVFLGRRNMREKDVSKAGLVFLVLNL